MPEMNPVSFKDSDFSDFGSEFNVDQLKYNAQGLIPCVAQDAETLEVLMLAWMNKDAVARTLVSGEMTYWSRSRQEFWVKGLTSGHRQELISLRFDCDQDALLALVKQNGSACHTGKRSCFYTEIKEGKSEALHP